MNTRSFFIRNCCSHSPMLTDDSNVELISQLMEHIFIEVPACLFFYFTAVYDYLGKCTHLRQMDAQSICMASQGGIEEFENGTIWARKRNWESSSPDWDQPPKNTCTGRSLRSSFEGFPLTSHHQLLAAHCIPNRWFNFQATNLLPTGCLRASCTFHLTRGLSPSAHLSSVCATEANVKIYYQLIPFRYLRGLIGRQAAVCG